MPHAARSQWHGSPWLVGKDSQGRWVVRDPSGLHGGIFANRAAALHFALFENGRHGAVLVAGILGLDMVPPPMA